LILSFFKDFLFCLFFCLDTKEPKDQALAKLQPHKSHSLPAAKSTHRSDRFELTSNFYRKSNFNKYVIDYGESFDWPVTD